MSRNERPSKDRRPDRKPERKFAPRPDSRGEKKPAYKAQAHKSQGHKSHGSKPLGRKSQGLKPQGLKTPAPKAPSAERPTGLWLYGIHAVRAALANPRRHVKRVMVTDRAAEEIGNMLLGRVRHDIVDMESISKMLPAGSVHQGAALNCEHLPRRDLSDALPQKTKARRIVLVLDQITDPHNIGAILRSAVAFGVSAVVVQDRNAPPESGVLAKSASGALDTVPYIVVVNISRALQELEEAGFWRIALAGDGDQSLQEAAPAPGADVALVLGSEGSGIRRLVREHCDVSAFIPIEQGMESLNVSNAAAVALYEMRRA